MDGKTNPAPGTKERWFLQFRIDGDLRFISHHDTMRMFERAFARAALPVRFSGGFNPRPRLSLPLPRPVGIASEAEALVVEFNTAIQAAELLKRLQPACPAAVEFTQARRLGEKESPRPESARYQFTYPEPIPLDIEARIERILASGTLPVTRRDRRANSRPTPFDVRPYLLGLALRRNVVEFTLRITGTGAARPNEVAGLLGMDPLTVNHLIRRMEVQWASQQ